MDVRAVILLGAETLGESPLSLVPVLGKSVLERTIDSLRDGGVTSLSVVAPRKFEHELPLGVRLVPCDALDDWEAAEQAFTNDVDAGAEVVIFARVGSYAEIDWKELIECHTNDRDRHTRVTRAWHRDWPLDVFIVNASRRNEAATLLRSQMQRSRSDCTRFANARYVNVMRDARDLRQLATDGLYQRCSLRPVGIEVRPGIWVGEGARIEKGARIVAPAYIGKRSRVNTGAAVTRGTSIEHHCFIDCATVLEDATVLPFTRVGLGLELAHSVADRTRISLLRRNAETVIHDPSMLAAISSSAGVRLANGLGSLFAALPQAIYRGLFPEKREGNRRVPAQETGRNFGAIHLSEPESRVELPELADFAVMRRYGNQ